MIEVWKKTDSIATRKTCFCRDFKSANELKLSKKNLGRTVSTFDRSDFWGFKLLHECLDPHQTPGIALPMVLASRSEETIGAELRSKWRWLWCGKLFDSTGTNLQSNANNVDVKDSSQIELQMGVFQNR